MFRDSCILRGKCHWCSEAVMWFMNGWIEERVVEKPVNVIEDNFPKEDAEDGASRDFGGAGKNNVKSIWRWFSIK